MQNVQRPIDDIKDLILSLQGDTAVDLEVSEDIIRFTYWISHFIIEIKGDELRYAIFGGDHSVEGLCDSFDMLEQVLRSEFKRLRALFEKEQQNLPGEQPH